MILDVQFLLFVALPGLILGGLATLITKTTFAKYSQVGSYRGLTGAQAARLLLDRQGLHDVGIERSHGYLSDHYDPRTRTLRLSEPVFDSNSLAAIGVACHEAGHALQHAQSYGPLALRSLLVPATNFGTQLSYPLVFLGMVLNFGNLILLGALLFGLAVVFSLVTLPVEWDASARAKRLMVSSGIVLDREQDGAAKVLNAAFLTYVASAVTAILTLVYYLLKAQSRR